MTVQMSPAISLNYFQHLTISVEHISQETPLGRVKRIWYLSPMRAAAVSAQSRQNLHCLLIQEVSQEEPSNRKPDPSPL